MCSWSGVGVMDRAILSVRAPGSCQRRATELQAWRGRAVAAPGMDRRRPALRARRLAAVQSGQPSARKKRIGELPTERLTMAANALGLA